MAAALTLIGRLHPLLVHLPIGILLLALFLEGMSMRPAYHGMKAAADVSLLAGFCCACLSCVTGWLLSQTGDYDPSVVTVHQWLAISLTAVSGFLWWLLRGRSADWRGGVSMGVVLVLLVLTGHWGGTLTHGLGYLTSGLSPEAAKPMLRPVADISSAVLYTSMVQPVLHDNCYGCHSAGKTKGGLRLDAPDRIMRGGKDGPVVVPGQAGASLMLKRVALPLDDDHHMAPKDKGQLTSAEIRLLRWWIDKGASFDKTVGQLPVDTGMTAVWAAFHAGTAGPVGGGGAVLNVADSDLPAGPVAEAPAEGVRRLRAAGALVLPVAEGSNFLEVNWMGDSVSREALEAIGKLREQVVSLRFSGVGAGDELVQTAAGCPRLVRLWLDHTAITGKNLEMLHGLANLRYLNLTGTAVGAADVIKLKGMSKLSVLYLYQTKVDRSDWSGLERAFPRAVLDSGRYRMPFLSSDTAIVREPMKK